MRPSNKENDFFQLLLLAQKKTNKSLTEMPIPLYVNYFKMNHDLLQFQYLLQNGRIKSSPNLTLLMKWLNINTKILKKMPSKIININTIENRSMVILWKKLKYFFVPEQHIGPVINPALDFKALDKSFRKAKFPAVVVDDFLTARALSSLRRLFIESMIWDEVKSHGSYLGALDDGPMNSPLLQQIKTELKKAFQSSLSDLPSVKTWAFKYQHKDKGTPLHSDQATFNANIWLMPNESLNDVNKSGMTIYNMTPPSLLKSDDYNKDNGRTLRALVKEKEPEKLVVKYKCNRLVFFKSNLIHETDSVDFGSCFEDHRVNLTFLFRKKPYPVRLY